jgi:predicted nucleic acid-binding protein
MATPLGITAYEVCYAELAVAVGRAVVVGDSRLVVQGAQSGLPVASASGWST